MLTLLHELQQQRIIRALDYEFAVLTHSLEPDPLLTLLAAQLSYELGLGNVCLKLDNNKTPSFFNLSRAPQHQVMLQALLQAVTMPVTQWRAHLGTLNTISDGSRATPIVLDSDYLYLYRYWRYECQVANFVAQQTPLPLDIDSTKTILDRLFNREASNSEVDWQQIAAAVAASHTLSIISGGPGTGKTTTVTRLLALLVELGEQQQAIPQIKLVAPTGKAAARLTESIGGALQGLHCGEHIKQLIPTQASTLHRLLGVTTNKAGFIHNERNPLHLDVLVVDEASMIDLTMMSQLLTALPAHARIIFLGDRDQLASVEAGSVFGDLCSAANSGYSLHQIQQLQQLTGHDLSEIAAPSDTDKATVADSFCLLRKSYRFDAHSGIGTLAGMINRNQMTQLSELFQGQFADIARSGIASAAEYQQLIQYCCYGYRAYLKAIDCNESPATILNTFAQFQLLCALRNSAYGVTGLNEAIEKSLRQQGLLTQSSGQWYRGRPILITRNDYGLGLYNGDVGITLQDDEGRFYVVFELPNGDIKIFLPSRLPAHETVFAMTIHKSQGSEFANVAMVLPPKDNPLITRELVYTGITRAKKQLMLFCELTTLIKAADARTYRVSGLLARLSNR